MNKQEAFDEINRIQDEYVNELYSQISSSSYAALKTISFTSPTGTGKTKMMSKLINKMSDYYFVVTTLSKGQLHLQVNSALNNDCIHKNFIVYGCADYKINTKLQAKDIINNIPENMDCIWLRDEGHIKTNRFEELLSDRCYKVINFSATNPHSDIQCNFTQTMMLRTVNQIVGTPEEAIRKLLEVKKSHKNVFKYNPCAIFRCVGVKSEKLRDRVVDLCNEHKLKYIDISEDPFIMAELCEDDNEYDVIINKYKIVEGIDIRRAHVIYMDNQPNNNATTIQAIGRCRRNALLYRDDIDIFSPENEKLLHDTRECYVYYKEQMHIDKDENGELQYAFCNFISCQSLKPNSTIEVINGQLTNGLHILELSNKTGKYNIIKDNDTGFNIVQPYINYYDKEVINDKKYLYFRTFDGLKTLHYKISIDNIAKLPIISKRKSFDYDNKEFYYLDCEPSYNTRLIAENFQDYESICELVSDVELHFIYNGYEKTHFFVDGIPVNQIKPQYSYKKINNDRESAIIGVDLMHLVSYSDSIGVTHYEWSESKTVSSKIGCYSKLNSFISQRYEIELSQARPQCFTGNNSFNFDKKCNSMLGYCVEYYSKYLLFGDSFLPQIKFDIYMDKKEHEILRRCMKKYVQDMTACFGLGVQKIIPTISASKLKSEYLEFENTVIELGKRTANYVKAELYPHGIPENILDTNLSIKHISGLADYITEDTILDVKVRNNIDEKCIRQVLAYHYLSTKRSDLHIRRVIVYDATSNKSVIINISQKNQIDNFKEY